MPFTVAVTCWLFTVPTTVSLALPLTVMEASVVAKPSKGASIEIRGGVVSRVTCKLAVLIVPCEFFADAVRGLFPSCTATETVNVPPFTGAGRPLTVTVALGSLTVPFTVTGLEFTNARLGGDVRVITAGAAPATFRTIRLEKTRVRLPLTGAETRKVMGKGLGSVSES